MAGRGKSVTTRISLNMPLGPCATFPALMRRARLVLALGRMGESGLTDFD